MKASKAVKPSGVTMKYTKIHEALGVGDFVLVMKEGRKATTPKRSPPFRVEKGKIAEHRDTMAVTPKRSTGEPERQVRDDRFR